MYSKKTTTTTTSSVGQPMTTTTVTQSSGMPEMYMSSGVQPVGMVRQQFTSYGGVPTTYVSGPTMVPSLMASPMMTPMGAGATTTTYNTSYPGFIQTPMIHSTLPYSSVTTHPSYMTTGWRTLGSPSFMGGFNGMSVMSTRSPSPFGSAPMSLMGTPTSIETTGRSASSAAFSSSSSLTINGVHCEGLIEINGSEITRAKNLFIGDGPFQLSGDFLTLSPEHVVMANDPHIKCHVADIPNQACKALSMEQMKTMLHEAVVQHNKEVKAADPSMKIPDVNVQNLQVHIGLPGQKSCMLSVDPQGHITMRK